MNITEQQFEAYLCVQIVGRYNMFDPQARISSGLDRETYVAVMKQYGELMVQYKETYEKIMG